MLFLMTWRFAITTVLGPVHIMPEKLKTQQPAAILVFFFTKTQAGKSRDYRDVIVFEKLRFQNISRPH